MDGDVNRLNSYYFDPCSNVQPYPIYPSYVSSIPLIPSISDSFGRNPRNFYRKRSSLDSQLIDPNAVFINYNPFSDSSQTTSQYYGYCPPNNQNTTPGPSTHLDIHDPSYQADVEEPIYSPAQAPKVNVVEKDLNKTPGFKRSVSHRQAWPKQDTLLLWHILQQPDNERKSYEENKPFFSRVSDQYQCADPLISRNWRQIQTHWYSIDNKIRTQPNFINKLACKIIQDSRSTAHIIEIAQEILKKPYSNEQQGLGISDFPTKTIKKEPKRRTWSEQENTLLMDLITELGKNGKANEKVLKHFTCNTGRKIDNGAANTRFKTMQAKRKCPSLRVRWRREEDRLLVTIINKHHGGQWKNNLRDIEAQFNLQTPLWQRISIQINSRLDYLQRLKALKRDEDGRLVLDENLISHRRCYS